MQQIFFFYQRNNNFIGRWLIILWEFYVNAREVKIIMNKLQVVSLYLVIIGLQILKKKKIEFLRTRLK